MKREHAAGCAVRRIESRYNRPTDEWQLWCPGCGVVFSAVSNLHALQIKQAMSGVKP